MTAAERMAAALARREALRAAEAEAYAEQQAADVEALVELEATHGFERVLRVDLGAWSPGKGAATMIVARVPTGADAIWRRFETKMGAAKKGTGDAQSAGVELATACLVYPEKGSMLYAGTLDLAPGILGNVALQIVNAVQGNAEKEKKD